VSGDLVDEGRPIVVSTESERIGTGPWARLFATAIVHDERSRTAQHGDELARSGAVHTFTVGEGTFSARVTDPKFGECQVKLWTDPVPPRIWAAMSRAARARGPLQAAVEGRAQSVHLQHLMTEDWEEPLVPRGRDIGRSCSCSPGLSCEHIAALAYVVADGIDRDPSLLLRWRGCATTAAEDELAAPQTARARPAESGDPWLGGELPEPRPARPLPVGSVLQRLGKSGIRAGEGDLADVLLPAYAAFARKR
jgi:uncharacterized Zn finger protein